MADDDKNGAEGTNGTHGKGEKNSTLIEQEPPVEKPNLVKVKSGSK